MHGIKPEDIEGAYLLSIEEVERLPKWIRRGSLQPWRLRSPGRSSNFAAFVERDGEVFKEGSSVNYSLAIRPAFRIRNLDALNLPIGTMIKIPGMYAALYIGNNSALLCQTAGHRRFDEKSNGYDESEVNRFLTKWLKEEVVNA